MIKFLVNELWVKIEVTVLEKLAVRGHKVIDRIGLEHVSATITFFEILILGTESEVITYDM